MNAGRRKEPDNWIGIYAYKDVPYSLKLFELSVQMSEQIFVAVGIDRFPGDDVEKSDNWIGIDAF